MNILIVSGAFYPTNSPRSFRTTELAKQFLRLGHSVTLYFPETDYDYTKFQNEYPITIKHYWRKRNERTFTGISIVDRIIFRALNQLFDYPNILLKKSVYNAVKNESGYDLLVTIAAPHQIHWAFGLLYQQGIKAAKTWVADCGDPYMLNGTGIYPKPKRYAQYEKLWCSMCDYITIPIEGAKKGYYPEFKTKLRVIPQAFNFSEVKIEEYKKNEVPTFAYSGSLWPGSKDPRTLLDYLVVNKEKNFKFVIYTDKIHLLKQYKDILGDKLELNGFIPRLDLLKKLSKMDFLVNFEFSTGVQSPSKMIDYTLTKRPILVLYYDKLDTKTFDSFLNGNYSGASTLPNIEDYDIKNVAKRFLSLCKI